MFEPRFFFAKDVAHHYKTFMRLLLNPTIYFFHANYAINFLFIG